MRRLTLQIAALLLAPLAARAQPAPTATGWFGGAHLGASVGNYDIDGVSNIGDGPFDAGGAIGIMGGRLWRHIGFAAGGELQQLLDARTGNGTGTGAGVTAVRGAPGLASARIDLLLPLAGRDETEVLRERRHRLLLVAGLSATRLDGAFGTGSVSLPEGGPAEVRGRGWSLGGQWMRAMGESQWLVADARLERFHVTSGRIEPSLGAPVVRTPSGGGTTLVVRLGARVFLPSDRR
ncbi:MAG TPA: hypothetical protein PKE51_10395 [Gemmatimonadaceae bacterium]|nr:hypothetical protein [Gemmatimonadaceae bacterium]